MLKLTLLELFFRLIPEGFLYIFASYAFSRTVIEKKKYITSSILLAVTVYLIRMLPIHYGVHTILSLVVCIVLSVSINGIDMMKSVQVAVVAMILGFVSEGINVLIIQVVLKADLKVIFENPIQKTLYGLPSLIIWGGCIGLYYFITKERRELKDVSNRKSM